MSDTAETLRALLKRTSPRSKTLGHPLDVRARVGAWLHAQHRSGESWAELGRLLSISPTTASSWALAAADGPNSPHEPAFLPVTVRAAAPPLSATTPVLVSPRGFRVQGLTLDQLAELLGHLG